MRRARRKPTIVDFRELRNDEHGVETLEGFQNCTPETHFVVYDVEGNPYPVLKTIFHKTYDIIDDMTDEEQELQGHGAVLVETVMKELKDDEARPTIAHRKPSVVCLCGSVRFRQKFEDIACWYTTKGFIVLMPNCWNHDYYHGHPNGMRIKEKFDRLHLAKIDLADHVFVINVDGYIGESTQREIDYAESKGKNIVYLTRKGVH